MGFLAVCSVFIVTIHEFEAHILHPNTGNQALGMFKQSTKSIERLTWTDDDIHTSDTCGMKYGDNVLFIREFMEGSSRSVAVLNNDSVVSIISEAPVRYVFSLNTITIYIKRHNLNRTTAT